MLYAAAVVLASLPSACVNPVSNKLYQPSPIGGSRLTWSGRTPVAVRTITADGVELTGWYWPATSKDEDLIVYMPGRAGNRDTAALRAQAFAEGGHGVLVASYRGYGDNRGTPSEHGLYDDGRAFVRLARHLQPHGRLFLFGDALGAAVALHAAVGEPVDAVVTLGAFDRFSSLAPAAQRPFYKDSFDNLSAIRQLRMPILIMHGQKDEVVPFAAAEKLRAAAGGRAVIVPIAGEAYHAFELSHIAPVVWQALDELTKTTPEN